MNLTGTTAPPPFPLTLGLTPKDQIAPVTIRIDGLRQGVESVTEIVGTGFVSGESRMLRSVLTAACLGVACAPDQSCVLGACTLRDRPGTALPDWPGAAPSRPGNTGSLVGGRSLWGKAWYTCATKDKNLFCWGDNENGQLGHGDPTLYLATRRPVLDLPQSLGSVGPGEKHTCVCEKTGQTWCWGQNTDGQLGTNDLQMRIRPVAVPGLNNCLQIAAGAGHTCALRKDGKVACWGRNSSGQTGQQTSTNPILVPEVVPGLEGVVHVVTGGSFSCALTLSTIQCWGDNERGQLGDGTTNSRSTPARVMPAPDKPTQLVAGRFSACAVLPNLKVVCWGLSSSGLLGAGPERSSTPVEIVGIDDAIQVAVGHEHGCVIRKTNVASCWGGGQFGQLGDGFQQNSFVPVDVVDIRGVQEIVAEYDHTCARHAGGISCWGQNSQGQLGDGSLLGNPRPVRVVGF